MYIVTHLSSEQNKFHSKYFLECWTIRDIYWRILRIIFSFFYILSTFEFKFSAYYIFLIIGRHNKLFSWQIISRYKIAAKKYSVILTNQYLSNKFAPISGRWFTIKYIYIILQNSKLRNIFHNLFWMFALFFLYLVSYDL